MMNVTGAAGRLSKHRHQAFTSPSIFGHSRLMTKLLLQVGSDEEHAGQSNHECYPFQVLQ